MTDSLAHSIFQTVIFPPVVDDKKNVQQDLQLRRVKRFVADPAMRLADLPIVVFDLETTGLDYQADRIIEIGAQKLVGLEAVDEYSSLIKPDIELTKAVKRITGISDEMLADQPQIEEILPAFLEFISGSILVAHNADFDLNMITAACARMGLDLEWSCFCTLKMARELLADLENKKLDTLAEHYGLSFEARHRSIGDVKVTAAVLRNMLEQEGGDLETWAQFEPFEVNART